MTDINLFGLTIPEAVWRTGLNLGLIILVLFIIKHFGSTVIDKIVRRAITSDRYSSAKAEKMREDTLISILSAILRVALWIFGTMLVLAQLGVNIGPLIAGASVAGIAIGFGAQAVVKDFVSGIFIILENQYRVGDVITLAGITGTVEEITVRQTILRDVDGAKHFIPNGQIGVTSNLTMDYSNLVLNIDIAYDADIDKVRKTIDEVGAKIARDDKFKDLIVESPKFLRVQEFGAHSVVVRAMGKMKPGSQWQVAGEMRLRLKQAFDKQGIEIPYQQLVIRKPEA
ncbi:mechanosensitive ion channel family protein [Candidatus Saccharibacteria bacterium]|nr:mechanosensitive ion channel family protein [Candidatus Saccharibacteria bacterium]